MGCVMDELFSTPSPGTRYDRLITILAQIKIGTDNTVVSVSRRDVTFARCADLHIFGSRRIVQLIQYHHTAMFGSSHFVKLAMI
mmetsp:Transcript_27294/g.65404  ORF Transcript_27294/g.65404 Transcript_27294/m.65404 type:complete len:84 (+) Transcript_27294:1740-1991(+)